MSGFRGGTTPLDHLIAETAAAPLSSEAALRTGLVALDPSMPAGSETCAVWRRLEADLQSESPNLTLDESIMLRDLLWFGSAADRVGGALRPRPQPLHRYLQRLADGFLRPQDGNGVIVGRNMRLTGGLEERLARRRWRWLTFALPPDLLQAACTEPERLDADSLPQDLARVLAQGFAETHLHLKAGMSFRDLWVALMVSLGTPSFVPARFAGPGAPLGEGPGLGHWLARLGVARLTLAAFLDRFRRNTNLTLTNVLAHQLIPELCRQLGASYAPALKRALSEVQVGRMAPPDGVFQGALRAMAKRLPSVWRLERTGPRADGGLVDPIDAACSSRIGGFSSEQLLVRQGLSYPGRRLRRRRRRSLLCPTSLADRAYSKSLLPPHHSAADDTWPSMVYSDLRAAFTGPWGDENSPFPKGGGNPRRVRPRFEEP